MLFRSAPWGNRVVGVTDELHFARPINPVSLQAASGGVILTPAHVHKAVRRYMGIDEFAQSVGVGLAAVEDIPLFDPSKMTLI
mgnify:CR=1 FL=1